MIGYDKAIISRKRSRVFNEINRLKGLLTSDMGTMNKWFWRDQTAGNIILHGDTKLGESKTN